MRASQKALQEALKLLWSGSRVLGRAGPCSKENKVCGFFFFFLSPVNDVELCQPRGCAQNALSLHVCAGCSLVCSVAGLRERKAVLE